MTFKENCGNILTALEGENIMYLTDYIKMLNQEITSKRNEYNYLAQNMMEIGKLNQEYKEAYQNKDLAYLSYSSDSLNEDVYQSSFKANREVELSTDEKNVIRKDLAKINEAIVNLKKDRDKAISQILNNSMISVADAIWILNEFGIYYRPIRVGNETMLIPQDTVILNNTGDGEAIDNIANNIINGICGDSEVKVASIYRKDENRLEKLNLLVRELAKSKNKEKEEIPNSKLKELLLKIKTLLGMQEEEKEDNIGYDLTGMDAVIRTQDGYIINNAIIDKIPMEELFKILDDIKNNYREKIANSYKISINNRLLDLVPAIKVHDLSGIQIYLPTKDGVKLNPDLLNAFNYEVLGFMEYYVNLASKDSSVTIEKAMRQFKGESLERRK